MDSLMRPCPIPAFYTSPDNPTFRFKAAAYRGFGGFAFFSLCFIGFILQGFCRAYA